MAEAGASPPLPAPAANATLPPLWRQREYRLLWTAQFSSVLGGQASNVVVTLLILQMTGSASLAGFGGALGVVPYLLLSLPVGVWVDRWDRKAVMVRCDAGRVVVALSLVAALLLDALTLPHLYLAAVLQGVLGTFFNLAEVAALPRVVDRSQLPQAVAQNHAAYAGAGIAGPALGTWLLQHAGRALPFGVDAIGHAISALCLWRLRTPLDAVPSSAPRNLSAEIMVGVRWLWDQPLVRRIAAITSCSNFVMAAVPLLLIVLGKRLEASEAQIGLVFSAGGIGGLLGAALGGWFARRFAFGTVITATLALQALMLAAMVLAADWRLLGAAYGVLMFCGPVYNVVQLSRRLAMIPDGLQGRVNAAFRLAANLLFPAGSVLCGVLTDALGVGWAVALFTLLMAALAGVAASSRTVQREGRGPPVAPAA